MRDNGSKVELATLIFGLSTLVIAVVMLLHFPLNANLANGFTTPIIAFEFAKTEADLVFLSGSSNASVLNRAMMDAGHQWDMLFPLAYAGFIALLIFKLIIKGSKWLWPFLLVALLIIPFDINENLTLLAITGALTQGSNVNDLLSALYIATWLKWSAIAISVGGLALGLLTQKRYAAALVSGVAALSITAYWIFNDYAPLAELMSALVSLFFLWFLLCSWIELRRSKLSAQRSV